MKGETKIVLGLVALGLVLTGVAWCGMTVRGEDALVVSAATQNSEALSIVWGGDTMVGDASVAVAKQRGYEWPFAGVRHLLDGDVVVVNAEARLPRWMSPSRPTTNYSYVADPASALSLASVGVTVLGLANNHTLDQGPTGLTDTFRYAREAGLATFGAGMNDSEAERPFSFTAPASRRCGGPGQGLRDARHGRGARGRAPLPCRRRPSDAAMPSRVRRGRTSSRLSCTGVRTTAL